MQAEDADWERAFASNPEKHRMMAREAQEDYLAGRTTAMDFDHDNVELKPGE